MLKKNSKTKPKAKSKAKNQKQMRMFKAKKNQLKIMQKRAKQTVLQNQKINSNL